MDEFKRFCKFEDNGDDTLTLLFCPEEGVEMHAIVALSFDEVMAGMSGVIDPSSPEVQAVMEKITIIPDSMDAL